MSQIKLERANAKATVERLRKEFDDGADLSVKELAKKIGITERHVARYINLLHVENGELYISGFEDSSRGVKPARYKMKVTGKEVDAPRWWLESHETDSEGGHCD